jgi:hypothetical protein
LTLPTPIIVRFRSQHWRSKRISFFMIAFSLCDDNDEEEKDGEAVVSLCWLLLCDGHLVCKRSMGLKAIQTIEVLQKKIMFFFRTPLAVFVMIPPSYLLCCSSMVRRTLCRP